MLSTWKIFPKGLQNVASVLPLTQGIKLMKNVSLGIAIEDIPFIDETEPTVEEKSEITETVIEDGEKSGSGLFAFDNAEEELLPILILFCNKKRLSLIIRDFISISLSNRNF